MKNDIKKMQELFGIKEPVTRSYFKAVYRKALFGCHPDRGGSVEKFIQLQKAFEELIDNSSLFTDNDKQTVTSDGTPLRELGLGLGFNKNGMECNICRGFGYSINCGRSFSVCPECEYGRVKRVFACKHCRGTGRFTQKYTKKEVVCRTCNGTGKFTHPHLTQVCSRCNGTATIYNKDNKTYYTKCYHCKGTGEIEMFNPVIPKGLLQQGWHGKSND